MIEKFDQYYAGIVHNGPIMVCEKMGSTENGQSDANTCAYYMLGVFDLKLNCSDRSVFDIKVPQECFKSIRSLSFRRELYAASSRGRNGNAFSMTGI